MNKEGIETKIQYSRNLSMMIEIKKHRKSIKTKVNGNFFRRQDFHDDGSVSDYCGLEMSEKDYDLFVELIGEPKDDKEKELLEHNQVIFGSSIGCNSEV